ncbi:hypothetical protein PG985_014342 [Apiospora marii]|uniref:Uncharacterized protein n=1 Tax=Apiospora marii TaxID=335849 RepID=A0ABR1R5E7_9PEZI
MRFSSVLNALFLISSVGATPTLDDQHHGSLEARMPPKPPGPPKPPKPKQPQPGIGEFKQQLGDIAKDSCLFYARVGNEQSVKDERDKRSYLSGYKILDERWQDRKWLSDRKKNVNGGLRQFFATASAALAQECSGVVYVFLPSDSSGTDFPDGTIWVSHEWPNLPKGTSVTKVVRLKFDDASHQETIYEMPAHKKREDDKQCSIRLTQWDEDKTEHGDGDKYALEFDVKSAAGSVLGHQTKVDVAMWDPLNWQGGDLLPGGLVVIPSGDKLFFWHKGAFWRSDDNHCQVGGWVDGEGEARNRELNCRFTC